MKNINEVYTIEELESYVEELTGHDIIGEYDEVYAIDALGSGLADFGEDEQRELISVAGRFIGCQDTVERYGDRDDVESVDDRWQYVIESAVEALNK